MSVAESKCSVYYVGLEFNGKRSHLSRRTGKSDTDLMQNINLFNCTRCRL